MKHAITTSYTPPPDANGAEAPNILGQWLQAGLKLEEGKYGLGFPFMYLLLTGTMGLKVGRVVHVLCRRSTSDWGFVGFDAADGWFQVFYRVAPREFLREERGWRAGPDWHPTCSFCLPPQYELVTGSACRKRGLHVFFRRRWEVLSLLPSLSL